MNLRKWITEYYTVFRALELKQSTVRSYLSFIGNVPEEWNVEDVSLYDVQKLINELSEKLSSSSVKHTFQIIKEPLENINLIGLPVKYRNMNRVKLPRMRKKIVHALTDEELAKLQPEIDKSYYADVYNVLLNTGMRFCELAGLSVGSFNADRMTLKIEQRFYRGNLDYGSKTESGIREIPIPKNLQTVCRKHALFKSPKQPLFCSKNNERLSYNTVFHDWHRICHRAEIMPCGLHVLRHTFASKLLEADVSLKIVSAILGHKSISITADIYCDVSMTAKRAALAVFEEYQNGKNSAMSF